MSNSIKNLNIVCYKWGDKYPSEDVNKLFKMVKRNLNSPFTFHCITDDSQGIDKDVITHPMPSEKLNGNGAKIFTFSSFFLNLPEDAYVVSLDLDIVIVDSLLFLTEQPEHDFIIARHRSYPDKKKVHGAVYRVRVGSLAYVWDRYIENHNEWAKSYRWKDVEYFSEQAWLEANIPIQDIKFFDYEKVISYKTDCNAIRTGRVFNSFFKLFGIEVYLNPFQKAELPNIGESIVSFAGEVDPRSVRDQSKGRFRHAPFIKQFWK